MDVLVIGQGGREHAIAWKMAQSPQVTRVFVAPGNGGTATEENIKNVAISTDDHQALLAFAQNKGIQLTLVGPEQPLVAGIVDLFQAHGLNILGPRAQAAQLEGSKSFCKDFLSRHHIPTAAYQRFDQLQAALDYVQHCDYPLVIKADGLAAGKGVSICTNLAQAEQQLHLMLGLHKFGQASNCVVIESFLHGEEASFIILVDGHHDYVCFASSQDHKRIGDADTGANTGGMGAYSPAPVVTDVVHRRIIDAIVEPTLKGLQHDGICYQGFLYIGLMIRDDGQPFVIEFNCRLGDPETQPLLLRLQSDFFQLCYHAATDGLSEQTIDFDPRPALGVVLASEGYPESYPTGEVIQGAEITQVNTKVFHAGTQRQEQRLLTSGGRVLCVCALGESIALAQQKAYQCVEHISWPSLYYRRDIGNKAVNRSI